MLLLKRAGVCLQCLHGRSDESLAIGRTQVKQSWSATYFRSSSESAPEQSAEERAETTVERRKSIRGTRGTSAEGQLHNIQLERVHSQNSNEPWKWCQFAETRPHNAVKRGALSLQQNFIEEYQLQLRKTANKRYENVNISLRKLPQKYNGRLRRSA
ncbi:hypothetical protein Q1695_000209 [Nippostrongylus brasiliensis]|nr:hypothetical protein Q1695_000209 [Nippostrongylus brasiliensis]